MDNFTYVIPLQASVTSLVSLQEENKYKYKYKYLLTLLRPKCRTT